jgi:hypothetical protein
MTDFQLQSISAKLTKGFISITKLALHSGKFRYNHHDTANSNVFWLLLWITTFYWFNSHRYHSLYSWYSPNMSIHTMFRFIILWFAIYHSRLIMEYTWETLDLERKRSWESMREITKKWDAWKNRIALVDTDLRWSKWPFGRQWVCVTVRMRVQYVTFNS